MSLGMVVNGRMLARCAPADRHVPLVDALFERQSDWGCSDDPIQALSRIGHLAGLAQSEIGRCLNDQTLADRLLALRAEASETDEVDATPTLIVEGQKLSGSRPLRAFASLIDPLLENG